MAHIVCEDAGYWFALSRPIGAAEVEVMVLDQRVHRFARLSVTLEEGLLVVDAGDEGAQRLDDHRRYEIAFESTPQVQGNLRATLAVLMRRIGSIDGK